HTDYAALESAIPAELKLRLLRGALQDETVASDRFGFTPFRNSPLERQLPSNDELALMTRLHCDCWTSLASGKPSRKELRRWRTIFRAMLQRIDRFGLLIHFGTYSDDFCLAGPEVRCVSHYDCLDGLLRDTLYQMTPN
ncbi:MAG: hypothetical protein R3C19_27470, partial [Planctomycetaceae bacterium]